ncbi:MAG TPA: hypothetical protein ACFYD4_05955 [Candidatus Wunengus sp. YC61]|uniref:hypothetical protein n=1 Tax=Candidatus Wunengus sp. YC61 TaxID=3367698 RepID=UPI004026674B
MENKELSLEEQKLKVRRKLLKLAVYGIPAISTILAAGEAYANGKDDDDDDDDDDHRAGTGIKKNRKKPNGPKKYKKGLS